MTERIFRIRDNVYHIYDSLRVYCTLILGKDKAVLIDTGYGFGDIYTVVKEITSLPIIVINTHGHVDHIQGNKNFDSISIHKDDHRLLRLHSSFIVKSYVYLTFRKTLKDNEKEQSKNYFKRNRQCIQTIEDGSVIDIGGNKLEIIHTPGHTKGSICVLDTGNRILYSGDSFSSHVWLFLNESMKIETYIQSTKKVLQRIADFDTILSSHFQAEFKSSLISKIKHCAENISLEKSRPYSTNLAGKALIYTEGFERITEKYGYTNFDEFLRNIEEFPPEDIAEAEITSIVFSKQKL